MNEQELTTIVEALLFASDKPLDAQQVVNTLQLSDPLLQVDPEQVDACVDRLNAAYDENGRAFTISYVGGGYTFVTRSHYHKWLQVFQHQNAARKISQAAMESLAIIAYKQPITKPEVDEIRGVDSGYVVRQLLEKNLIEVAGRYDGPGRALLYRTTSVFLQHFGINSVDELPKPREIDDILQDDDMAEHRQLYLDLKSQVEPGGETTAGNGSQAAGENGQEQPEIRQGSQDTGPGSSSSSGRAETNGRQASGNGRQTEGNGRQEDRNGDAGDEES